MSVQLINKAFQTDIAPTARFVLVALANQVNNKAIEKGCWPSLRYLRARTGYSERTIQAALGRLVDAGHITIFRRTGTSSLYLVHPKTPRKKCGGASRPSRKPGEQPPPARDAPPSRNICATTPAAAAPKPEKTKKETSRQVSRRGAAARQIGDILRQSNIVDITGVEQPIPNLPENL